MYSLQIREEKQVEMKKREKKRTKDIKSCTKVELWKKTKNTFIFTTVITGYIISVFLCVGSWCHIEKENKGKKENSKTTGLQKSQKKERYYPSKRKKNNVIQKVEICYIWISKTWNREMQNAYKHKYVKKNKFKMLLAKTIRYSVKMQREG